MYEQDVLLMHCGCKNSLFLLKLGKNKESEVLEQHEAH